MKINLRIASILFLILSLSAAVRLYKLDEVPGSIYGDIVIVFDYIGRVLQGKWPFDYVLSSGPLYHYIVAPVILFLGESYLSLKTGSVLIGLLTVIATFFMTKELVNPIVALITAEVTAVSMWSIIFGRLGNSHTIIPLLVVTAFYFLLRLEKLDPQRGKSNRFQFLTILFASFGWYTFPQTFILPILVTGLVTLLQISRMDKKSKPDRSRNYSAVLGIIGLSVLFFLPFLSIVISNPANFTNGYIGSHMTVRTSLLDIIRQIAINFYHALGMFHFRGDIVFRSNIPGRPHLDFLSGILFLIGLRIMWKINIRKAVLYGITPILVLILPSVMVLNQPQEVPSASRSIGVTPFVYMFVSIGLYGIYRLLRDMMGRHFVMILTSFVIIYISYSNLHGYFFDWVKGLPNHNIAFDKVIANKINDLPESTRVVLISCCWGQWGQPEPRGIEYALPPKNRNRLILKPTLECKDIDRTKSDLIILNPHDKIAIEKFSKCLGKEIKEYKESGEVIFDYLE